VIALSRVITTTTTCTPLQRAPGPSCRQRLAEPRRLPPFPRRSFAAAVADVVADVGQPAPPAGALEGRLPPAKRRLEEVLPLRSPIVSSPVDPAMRLPLAASRKAACPLSRCCCCPRCCCPRCRGVPAPASASPARARCSSGRRKGTTPKIERWVGSRRELPAERSGAVPFSSRRPAPAALPPRAASHSLANASSAPPLRSSAPAPALTSWAASLRCGPHPLRCGGHRGPPRSPASSSAVPAARRRRSSRRRRPVRAAPAERVRRVPGGAPAGARRRARWQLTPCSHSQICAPCVAALLHAGRCRAAAAAGERPPPPLPPRLCRLWPSSSSQLM